MAHRCKCLKKDSWNVTELKKDNIVRNINIHTGGHQRTYWHMHTCACCSTQAYSCAHAHTHTQKMDNFQNVFIFSPTTPICVHIQQRRGNKACSPRHWQCIRGVQLCHSKKQQHSKLFPLSFVKIVGWVQIDGLVTFCPAVTQLLTGLKPSTN